MTLRSFPPSARCSLTTLENLLENQMTEKETQIAKWFMWLALEMQATNFTTESILSIDIEAWDDYREEGLTPPQAIREEDELGS